MCESPDDGSDSRRTQALPPAVDTQPSLTHSADCTNTNFPGWFLPEPGSAGLITLANTQFCLDAGPGTFNAIHI